jgi:chemotaxis receptor (MCP) glutamine deamidase CheD
MLTIGRRNVLAARSVLWQNGIMVHGEDVGGVAPRTVTIAVASGHVTVKSDGRVVTEL